MKSTTITDVIDLPAKRPEQKASEGNTPPKGGAPAKGGAAAKDAVPAAPGLLAQLRQSVSARLGTLAATPWSWVVITCVMLGVSGGIRFWRDLEFYDLTKESRNSPFALDELPKVLGAWRMDEGAQARLDPEISRIAGATDHWVRQYTNFKTGESTTVLVMYGLASVVCFHTPEVCYPAAGFQPAGAEPMQDRELEIPGLHKEAGYRQGFFSRTIAGRSEYDEVVYSFRHSGEWITDGPGQWKKFRYHPGMFKIQIQRAVTDLNSENSASVELLRDLMKEIELRLASKESSKAKAGEKTAMTNPSPAAN